MKSTNYMEGVVITATQLKQNLGKYLNMVMAQNDVVIKKNGNKIARLTPYVTDIEQYFTVKENALDYQYGGKKVSYDEYMEISQKSTLRMEYINSEIILMESPDIKHQELIGRLYLIFSEYFRNRKCKVFLAPFDVKFNKKGLKEPDVIQPDLLIACDISRETVTDNNRYTGTPALVIEILSQNTRSKDMIDKLNTYMLSGVKEYWVIDPKNETILIYCFNDCDIDMLNSYKKSTKAPSNAFKDLCVNVDELFKELIF